MSSGLNLNNKTCGKFSTFFGCLLEEYPVMSTKPYRTDFRNRTIEFYRTESNDRCSIIEPDRIVIELYRKIFSSIKARFLIAFRLSLISD